MGILDFFFGKDEAEETEDGESDEGAGPTDENGDDVDSTIARAIDGANSISEKDWFAQEQLDNYIAIAKAGMALKKDQAKRRAHAEAVRLQEETRLAKLAQKKAWDEEQATRREREKKEWEAENRAKAASAPKAEESPAKVARRVGQVAGPAARIPQQPDPAERAATARLANAQAAKIEAEAAVLRAQLTAALTAALANPGQAADGAAPKMASAAPGAKMATFAPARSRAPRGKTPSVPINDNDGYTEADRLALASVGHWPPTPPGHRGAFWSKHDDWPRDWTLTGGDLGRFRGEINLTRAVFAAQLGVPSAVVKDAELNPRERVGPALQIAVRRAMDQAIQARRARREERAAAQAPAEAAAAVVPLVLAPVVVAQTTSEAARAFTGADLARLRAERRLSQRQMADLLGVEQGTISKGEGKAGAALGPALQEALGRLAAGGGAGGAGVTQE